MSIAEDAIDLFLEYRDKHGFDEPEARAKALCEFIDADAAQPRGMDADSIRRARDREWCNRLEIQETLRPDDKELDVHLAFLCRKMAGGVE